MTDDTADALQGQIEEAQAAGDQEKAQALYQQQQGTADADSPGPAPAAPDGEGDPSDADTDDDAAGSLSAVGAPPDGEWTFGRPEVVDHQFALMEAAFGELATDLKSEWGADSGRNLEFAAAASREFEANYPEIVSVVNKHGGTNDPLIVELLAVLGRQWAETPGDPGTVRLFPNAGGTETRQPNMADNTATKDIEERIRDIGDQIDKAKARQDTTRANSLYQETLALDARLPGGRGPIVGSGGRVT